jgi:hypothetical protein
MMPAARKNQTPIERIDRNIRYAEAIAVQNTLEDGLNGLKRDRDIVKTEDYLGRQDALGEGRQKSRGRSSLRLVTREDSLRRRLAELRASAPRAAKQASAPEGAPSEVTAALELLRTGARPPRRDVRRVLEQLDRDIATVNEGLVAQKNIVACLKDELSAQVQTARGIKSAWDAIRIAKYRAAQALAAATDDERALWRSIIEAGYTRRDDLLPTPVLRAALVLGSESEFDSEISRARRWLESAEVLK